ncbi:MAG: BMC domain-containing protein [Proteocatella sp.]
MKNFNAIGVVEITFFTNALIVLDEMLKASEVHLVACEKKLGGRMVTIIVGGNTSSVNAAIETALDTGERVGEKNIKVAVSIPNPHPEIRKLLNLIKQDTPKETAVTVNTETEVIETENAGAQTQGAETTDKIETEQKTETIKPKTRRKK